MRHGLRNSAAIGLLVGGSTVAISAGWLFADTASNAVASAEVIEHGQQIYEDQCSACHGATLEGQPDWRSPLPSGRLPAPPHDASGHTWHHADDVLFRIVKEGTASIVGGGYESDMPGFGDVLSDADIRAVLRIYQEHLAGARAQLSGEHVTGELTIPSLYYSRQACSQTE